MEKEIVTDVIEWKKNNFRIRFALQVTIICFFISMAMIAIWTYSRDYGWNSKLQTQSLTESILLVVIDDVKLYETTKTNSKLSFADELFQRSLNSSQLQNMVFGNQNFRELYYRETPMQLSSILVFSIITLGLIAQICFPIILNKEKYNKKKWDAVTHLVGELLLIVGIALYIQSFQKVNKNYIEIANVIREKVIRLSGIKQASAISETIHACQLRAILQGQSEGLAARLEKRGVCDNNYLKLVLVILGVFAFTLILVFLLLILLCQRGSNAVGDAYLDQQVSELSLYLEVRAEDFRKAGFPLPGDELDDQSLTSAGSGNQEGSNEELRKKKIKKPKKGDSSSKSSSGSDSSMTFGNREKGKNMFKILKGKLH